MYFDVFLVNICHCHVYMADDEDDDDDDDEVKLFLTNRSQCVV